jgi:hypothetical protein
MNKRIMEFTDRVMTIIRVNQSASRSIATSTALYCACDGYLTSSADG